MASSTSNKGPPPKNVIYDSRNDSSAGGKRAVETSEVLSVAERARLFGAQIDRSSAPQSTKSSSIAKPFKPSSIAKPFKPTSTAKPIKPSSPPRPIKPPASPSPSVSPSVEEQPTRAFHSQADPNYQRYRSGASQNYAYSSAYRPPQNYPPVPPLNYDRPTREQASFHESQPYSTTTRSRRQQEPRPAYDSAQDSSPNKSRPRHKSHTSVSPGDSYVSEDGSYYQSQRRRRASPSRHSSYFRPIQDPLEVLYTQSSYEYTVPSMSTTNNGARNGFQAFDLGSLIGRIQQDYLNNARPYVSSIQFIENEQNLANIGQMTPGAIQKDYANRTSNDLYLRPGASYNYEVIDTSQFFPTYTRSVQNQHSQRNNHHPHQGSARRRRHHGHYRDRASSPINVAPKPKPPTPPPPNAPEEKPPTPAASEGEEDETANTKTEENKATAFETSSEEETDEEEEESTAAAPATAPPPHQRPGVALPGLASSTPTTAARAPVKQESETESSESEESESESDSDSDSDSEKRKKSKPPARPVQVTPKPAARGTPQPAARGTPQSVTRGTPQSTPVTTKTVTNKANDPPESSNSVKSFDVQDSKKSPGIGNRFKSMTKVFRRKKS